jgi:D-sedoheptulose 7-phosphate isomerase
MTNTDEFFQLKQTLDLRIQQFNDFKDSRRLAAVLEAVARMADSLEKGGKILVFGNGGSSTQASHFAAELVNKFYLERKPLPAVALSADSANLTSIANDTDYKYVFSRQVEALGKPGDVAVGISTSGRSANVLEALHRAKAMNMKTIAVCGSHTEPMQRQGIDVIIPVPSEDTPIIQEIHLFILHTMAEMLESKFFSANAKKG